MVRLADLPPHVQAKLKKDHPREASDHRASKRPKPREAPAMYRCHRCLVEQPWPDAERHARESGHCRQVLLGLVPSS